MSAPFYHQAHDVARAERLQNRTEVDAARVAWDGNELDLGSREGLLARRIGVLGMEDPSGSGGFALRVEDCSVGGRTKVGVQYDPDGVHPLDMADRETGVVGEDRADADEDRVGGRAW